MRRVRSISGRLTGALLMAILLATFPYLAGRAAGVPLASPAVGVPMAPRSAAPNLPLGPRGLPETRTEAVLQPGLTLTTIVRGTPDPNDFWTVEVNIPAGSTSPDPDAPPAALSDRTSAEALGSRLRAAGFSPRVEEVTVPGTADYAPGTLGWRVRVGHAGTQAEADALLAQLVAKGFAGASRFTGWDGSPTDRGPWHLQVLTIDPRTFAGRLFASYGPDIEDRETTSVLSRAVGATAGVNGGYFVLDPAAGELLYVYNILQPEIATRLRPTRRPGA